MIAENIVGETTGAVRRQNVWASSAFKLTEALAHPILI